MRREVDLRFTNTKLFNRPARSRHGVIHNDVRVIHVAFVRDRDLIPDLVAELIARRGRIRRLTVLSRRDAQRHLFLAELALHRLRHVFCAVAAFRLHDFAIRLCHRGCIRSCHIQHEAVHDVSLRHGVAARVGYRFANRKLRNRVRQLRQRVVHRHAVVRHVASVRHDDLILDRVADSVRLGVVQRRLIDIQPRVNVFWIIRRIRIRIVSRRRRRDRRRTRRRGRRYGRIRFRCLARHARVVLNHTRKDVIRGHHVRREVDLRFTNTKLFNRPARSRHGVIHNDVRVIHVAFVRNRDLIPDLVAELIALLRRVRRVTVLNRRDAQRHLFLAELALHRLRHVFRAVAALRLHDVAIRLCHRGCIRSRLVQHEAVHDVSLRHGVAARVRFRLANRKHRNRVRQLRQRVVHRHAVVRHVALVRHDDLILDRIADSVRLGLVQRRLLDIQRRVNVYRLVVRIRRRARSRRCRLGRDTRTRTRRRTATHRRNVLHTAIQDVFRSHRVRGRKGCRLRRRKRHSLFKARQFILNLEVADRNIARIRDRNQVPDHIAKCIALRRLLISHLITSTIHNASERNLGLAQLRIRHLSDDGIRSLIRVSLVNEARRHSVDEATRKNVGFLNGIGSCRRCSSARQDVRKRRLTRNGHAILLRHIDGLRLIVNVLYGDVERHHFIQVVALALVCLGDNQCRVDLGAATNDEQAVDLGDVVVTRVRSLIQDIRERILTGSHIHPAREVRVHRALSAGKTIATHCHSVVLKHAFVVRLAIRRAR